MNRALNLALISAAGLACVALSALCLLALNTGGEVRAGPLTLVRLAAGYARPAEKLLEEPVPSPLAARKAADLSHKALGEFPYDASSWLRLAYADRIRNGRLTPEGVGYLKRSYDLVGVDIYAGVWRVGFVLENSQAIPKDLRAAARNEVEALWKERKHREQLGQMAAGLHNPAGRLSAALWLNRLRSQPGR